MKMNTPGSLFGLMMMLLINAGVTAQEQAFPQENSTIPDTTVRAPQTQAPAEFRAAWIATVDNIDWPSRGNYDSESQKQEFIDLLDMHKKNGMNAVIVQVRPATDAFYPSSLEPWSEWLTGKQGKAPFPYYDPLEFMITETHKRGMEFHAWANPYRAELVIGKSSIAPDHITRIHPEWFVSYGGKRYFDPGNKEAQEHVVKVIRDIVARYNVDAIHFDDYFYPYKVRGQEFPDQATFKKYGNGMTLEEWRRSNVDSIILKLATAIKEEDSYCKFGISPFGVWRNNDKDPLGSATKAGVTNYDDLYANVLLWLKEGWIDYVAPQLYWEIGHKAAPYEVLVDWWSKNTYGRHCYIGLGLYRAGSNSAWKDVNLLPNQIKLLRSYPEIQGAIYFSSKSFLNNPNGWNDTLQNNYYKDAAIIPEMPWLEETDAVAKDAQGNNAVAKETPIKKSKKADKDKEDVIRQTNQKEAVAKEGEEPTSPPAQPADAALPRSGSN